MPGPDPLAALASRPTVVDAVAAARQACTELRWHPALRRRTAEVRTEACVRAAAASAELDGVRLPLAQVRAMVAPTGPTGGHVVGAADAVGPVEAVDGLDAVGAVVRGALRATLATFDLARGLDRAPAQVIARLHTLAAADLVALADQAGPVGGGSLGRPAASATGRVQGLVRLLAGGTHAPGPVLAALAEAELTVTGAFTPSGGVVARALARTVVVASGLDPHGVVVPERHGLTDRSGREAALAGYATGDVDGVQAWVLWWAEAVVAGAGHGRRVAEEVMAGRLA